MKCLFLVLIALAFAALAHANTVDMSTFQPPLSLSALLSPALGAYLPPPFLPPPAEPMASLVESFSSLTADVEHAMMMAAPVGGAKQGEFKPENIPGTDLLALLKTTQTQIANADPKQIPPPLVNAVTTLGRKVVALQSRLRALTDLHYNEHLKAAQTFKTPGSPRIGFQADVTTGKQADNIINVFKATQKYRKISNEEIETTLPGHVDTKPGF